MTDHEAAVFSALTPLVGTWSGEGRGQFPTITPFDFRERLSFERDSERPLIHYEQRAWHREDASPEWVASHWESGFLRPAGPDTIEMTNAQDGGRLEILRFRVIPTPQGVRLVGNSVALVNDPRLVSTHREYEVDAGILEYRVRMATGKVPGGELHLRARLTRASPTEHG